MISFGRGGRGRFACTSGSSVQAPRHRPSGRNKKKKGRGRGKADATESKDEPKTQFRDRAAERREEKEGYERVVAQYEQQAEVSIKDSKALGGDLARTHLVKGLDRSLLQKVRHHLAKKRAQSQEKAAAVPRQTPLGSALSRGIWKALCAQAHPHHRAFEKRMQDLTKSLSVGKSLRGRPSHFLPGRMVYEFDTGSARKEELPNTIFLIKDDAARPDRSKWAVPVHPDVVASIRKARENGRQRRIELAAAAAAAAAARRLPRAKDDVDIFAMDPEEAPAESSM